MMSVEGYIKVANKKDLKEGGLLRVEPEGKPIVLAMIGGKIYAMDAVCSHEGGPLDEGTLEGYELKCPWHYAVFDVRNAKVSDQTVWATDLQSYPVKVDESTGEVMVSLQLKPAAAQTLTTEPKKEQQQKQQNADAAQKKYYEAEERKAKKITIELLSKEQLPGTDIMSFRFTRQGLDFKAGQFAFFELDNVSADSKGPIRHFSIASSPTEQDMLISTRIRDTPYKQKLASLQQGTKISAWGPQGEFVLREDKSKPAVFLSGGIGVTPFRSMIKFATDKKLAVRIIVFDSNRNEQNILYKKEFDAWAQENKNLKIVYTVTDEGEDKQSTGKTQEKWKGERGRIDRSMLERHLSRDEIGNAVFYVCGPPGMLKAMEDLLKKDLKIPKERVKVEEFTGY